MKAQAMWFAAPGKVQVAEVRLPAPKADEVLVRTRYSGISGGTELLAYRGELDPTLPLDETIGALSGTFAYPFRYGYSCVGVAEGSCGAIEEGTLVFAFHPHQDRFVAAASDLVPLDGADPRSGTLFPLVETALQVCLDAGPVRDEPVVVLGLGPVGILVATLLAQWGARVVGSEPRPWRRRAAEAFGVTSVAPEDLEDAVAGSTGGTGVALLVDATGHPDALAAGLPLLRHEGTALVASWYGSKPVPLPLGGHFHRRRLSIRSSQVSTIPTHLQGQWTVTRRRSVVRRLLDELPLHALATHEFAFADAAAAFAAVERGEEALVHAALRYG